jgi:hypothetical protein
MSWAFTFLSDHSTVAALLLSGVALLSSRQDAGRQREFAAVFWQGFALFVLVVYLLTAMVHRWWLSIPVVAASLCVEIWLARRWRSSGNLRHK